MKTLLTIAVITIISVAASADDKDQVGRYQLFYGTFVSLRSSDTTLKEISRSEEKTVFKIDTVTGQVWKLNSVGLRFACFRRVYPDSNRQTLAAVFLDQSTGDAAGAGAR